MKLGKRECDVRLTWRDSESYAVYLLGKTFGSIVLPTWELVALWFKIGELLGFDIADAKYELERLNWRHDEGVLDEQTRFMKPGRKNKPGFKRKRGGP